ncbi:MAG: M3 family peptidase, partial [Chitinophagia bacterium]|nr:M3 family peptidase [Chitinophagia bacterium]
MIMNDNPLLYRSGLPPFDKIKAEHVEPAVSMTLQALDAKFQALEDKLTENFVPTWENLLGPIDDIEFALFRVWSPVTHLMGVMNSDELRKVHDKMQPQIIKFGLKTSQSKVIYKALNKLKESSGWALLSKAQQRIVDKNITSMKLSGVGLEGPQKERYNSIAQELAVLKTTFSNNALDSTKSWSMTLTTPDDIAGLPDHALALASQNFNRSNGTQDATAKKGPWRFTQDAPSFLPFIENSTRRDLREKIYRGRIALASDGTLDNSPIIEKILKLREEQSKILGFNSFAEQSLKTKMAG